MKSLTRTRAVTALLLSLFLLGAPLSALAKKGEKNYKRGLTYERAEQWEKAAQEFALAVAASPSDVEYQLHYRRAIFNASQIYMQKGRMLAEKGDYVGAYNAFRTAYGYDPVNELAAAEMRRMLRSQREKEGLEPIEDENSAPSDLNPQPQRTSMQPASATTGAASARGAAVAAVTVPEERTQPLRNINYNGDLEEFVRDMARQLNLNVVFDQQFSQQKRNIKVQLTDVTAAQALDWIFLTHGLFFQKLSRRTILVADQSKRPQYQQLVLRTFYLFNIKPADARTLIQTALPANAGRQPQVVTNTETNSIIVRDTPENVRIIGELLKSVDKDRAEVVMEVSIYEVSRSDLLQVGNQVGTESVLTNLGGIAPGSLRYRGTPALALGQAAVGLGSGVGLLIPPSSLSLLQSKDNTRLVFRTQVHAFDDEKSEARVGARVPVQTASVTPFGFVGNQPGGGTGTGTNPGVFPGNGFPVIQYEDTGLVLDFTPKVYPNQEVQVKMNIETKDVGAGANPLTPSFTQRKITGTARIPNGRTMMLASIAQDREKNGRVGLPVLGLIPILGRLFTAPRKDNLQSDVVITLTPRILRAPEITPRDEQDKPSGTMQTPRSDSLEAMIQDEDRDDALAAARKLPRNASAQVSVPAPEPQSAQAATQRTAASNAQQASFDAQNLPPAIPEGATFVPAPKLLAESAATNAGGAAATDAAVKTDAVVKDVAAQTNSVAQALPASNSTDVLKLLASSEATAGAQPVAAFENLSSTAQPSSVPSAGAAELSLVPEGQELKAGERRRLMLLLKTDAPLSLVAASFKFDPRILAVRSISGGALAQDKTLAPVVTHTVDPRGVLVVSVAPAPGGQALTGEGLLLILEVEGLSAGEATLDFDANKIHLIATDGRIVKASAAPARLKVSQ